MAKKKKTTKEEFPLSTSFSYGTNGVAVYMVFYSRSGWKEVEYHEYMDAKETLSREPQPG